MKRNLDFSNLTGSDLIDRIVRMKPGSLAEMSLSDNTDRSGYADQIKECLEKRNIWDGFSVTLETRRGDTHEKIYIERRPVTREAREVAYA